MEKLVYTLNQFATKLNGKCKHKVQNFKKDIEDE